MKYQYDETTGKPVESRSGGLAERHAGCPPRCQSGVCPKGKPEDNSGLTEENQQALQHYYECQAVGDFQGDAITRHNFLIIKTTIDAVKAEQIRKDRESRGNNS